MFLLGESIRHALFVDASLNTSNRANEKKCCNNPKFGSLQHFYFILQHFFAFGDRFTVDAATRQLPDVHGAPSHRRTSCHQPLLRRRLPVEVLVAFREIRGRRESNPIGHLRHAQRNVTQEGVGALQPLLADYLHRGFARYGLHLSI